MSITKFSGVRLNYRPRSSAMPIAGKTPIYLNSAGSHIEQEKMNVTLRVSAIAAENGEVQQAGLSTGSPGDFSFMRNQHAEVERIGKQAVTLLSAPQIKGGEYTVVLDPILAGVFVHEAFGHLIRIGLCL